MSRAFALTCALAAGCNRLYGVDQTVAVDAPIDAPTRCPAFHEVPTYTRSIHQVVAQACTDYSVSSAGDLALALCTQPYGIAEGMLDAPLTTSFSEAFDQPRLDPDGTRVYLREHLFVTTSRFDVYVRQTGTWVFDSVLPFGMDGDTFGNVAHVADEVHVILVSYDVLNTITIHEFVGAAGAWAERLPAYTMADLGVGDLASPKIDLSPDGLRIVIEGTPVSGTDTQMLYGDRETTADRFGQVVPIDLPIVTDAFVTEDCTRIYYSGLGRIFFASRI